MQLTQAGRVHRIFPALLAALLLASFFLFGLYVGLKGQQHSHTPINLGMSTEILQGAPGSLRLRELKGSLVVIYFGYTYCPDACPVGLATLRDTLQLLEATAPRLPVHILFISIDPQRDDLARILAYTEFFHNKIKALTGAKDDMDSLLQRFGVYAKPVPGSGANDYLLDHSTGFYVFDYSGELHRLVPHNATAEMLIETIKALEQRKIDHKKDVVKM